MKFYGLRLEVAEQALIRNVSRAVAAADVV